MSRLTEIEWKDGEGLYEMEIWGVSACRALVDAATDRIDAYEGFEGSEQLRHLLVLMDDRLAEMGAKLSEWHLADLKEVEADKPRAKKGGQS